MNLRSGKNMIYLSSEVTKYLQDKLGTGWCEFLILPTSSADYLYEELKKLAFERFTIYKVKEKVKTPGEIAFDAFYKDEGYRYPWEEASANAKEMFNNVAKAVLDSVKSSV